MTATSEEALKRKAQNTLERNRANREAEKQRRQAAEEARRKAEEEDRRKAEEQQQKAAKKRENDRLRIAAKRHQKNNNMSHPGTPARPNRSAPAKMLQPSPLQSALSQRILDPNISVDDALRFAALAAPGDVEAARTQQVMMQEAERTQQVMMQETARTQQEAQRTQQVMMQETARIRQEEQRTRQEEQRTRQESFRLDRTESERMMVEEIGRMDGGNQSGAVMALAASRSGPPLPPLLDTDHALEADSGGDDGKLNTSLAMKGDVDRTPPKRFEPSDGEWYTNGPNGTEKKKHGRANGYDANADVHAQNQFPVNDTSGSPLRGAVACGLTSIAHAGDSRHQAHSAAAQAPGGFNPSSSAQAGAYGHHPHSTAGGFNSSSSTQAGAYANSASVARTAGGFNSGSSSSAQAGAYANSASAARTTGGFNSGSSSSAQAGAYANSASAARTTGGFNSGSSSSAQAGAYANSASAARTTGGFNSNSSAYAGDYGHRPHFDSTVHEINRRPPCSPAAMFAMEMLEATFDKPIEEESTDTDTAKTMTSERPVSASSFSSSSNQKIPDGDLSGQVGMHPKQDPRTCDGKRTLAAPTPTKKKRAKMTETPSNGGKPPRSSAKKKTSAPASTPSTRILRSRSKK